MPGAAAGRDDRKRLCAFALACGGLIHLLTIGTVFAAEPPGDTVAPLPAETTDRSVRTEGRVETAEGVIDYEAVAGTVILPAEGDGPKAEIFFVSYASKAPRPAGRPITFAFNGGPGASSAYLHLGALGPRRVVLNDDGTIPPPPVRLEANETSWIGFTDLVFVDPVGTGYSRSLDPDGDKNRAFWGVAQDARIMAEFIRLYLTRFGRWQSPKYLVGESYGGVRAATLAQMLQSADFGIDLSGIVFISPVLEYALTRPGPYNVLPWAVVLPSYAATAHHHLKPGADGADRPALAEILSQAEAFAFDDYLPALAAGGRLDPAQRDALYRRIAGVTGLPEEIVRRNGGRVPFHVYAREILRERGLIASVYDTSLTVLDLDPAAPFYNSAADPTLAGLAWPFTAAMTSYVRDVLQFHTDSPYRLLNDELIEHWDWTTGIGSEQGFVTTAGGLELALAINPSLRMFFAHGYYDLVTPYFATRFVIDQMKLPPALQGNVRMRNYESGHMIYTHRAAREALFADVKSFYASTD